MSKTVFAALMQIPSAWLNALSNHNHDGTDTDGSCPQLTKRKNLIINGCCRVAQRAAPTITNTGQYGATDRFLVHATGSAVSAGSITQDAAASIGSTGKALHISGLTLTGTGILYVKHRIEAADAVYLKNQLASFSAQVLHDVGSAVNYTITIRKPTTTADTFSAVTDIQAGAATAVASGVATTISLVNVNLGDCSKGIEVEIKVECGAVTTKAFRFADLQLEPGAVATQFEYRPYGEELMLCQRYYQKYGPGGADNTLFAAGMCDGTTSATLYLQFTTGMRVNPTFTCSALGDFNVPNNSGVAIELSVLTGAQTCRTSADITINTAGGLTGGWGSALRAHNTSSWLAFEAEI